MRPIRGNSIIKDALDALGKRTPRPVHPTPQLRKAASSSEVRLPVASASVPHLGDELSQALHVPLGAWSLCSAVGKQPVEPRHRKSRRVWVSDLEDLVIVPFYLDVPFRRKSALRSECLSYS